MDRRRGYKQPPPQQQHEAHHYEERYNGTYDNYDYEEDYGNQYANTVPHHHHSHPHPHHTEDYDEEEEHWAQQAQGDFYDTVPATPPVKQVQKPVARVQISTAPQMDESRFGAPVGYGNSSNNNNNDRKTSKYGNMATTDQQKPRDVHIRFDPTSKNFPPKQSFIDGFRSQDALPIAAPKKKEPTSNNTIKSIISNLKSSGGEKQEDTMPRNRVSTNPFMRANQQQLQNQMQSRSVVNNVPSSKNVAEVVEKMNNGDWPIQIEDDTEVEASKRGYQAPHPDKARQWETLHRKKDEKRSIVEEPITAQAPPLPTQQPPPPHAHAHAPPQLQKHQHPQSLQKQPSHEEEEHTSISSDSALCSESSETRGPSPYKLPFDSGKNSELSEEAEKLLFYFKSHKDVLNYLGIGLTDRLWKHVQKLPNFDASIRVFKSQNSSSDASNKIPQAPPISQNAPVAPPPPSAVNVNVPAAPKITLSQSFVQQERDRKSPSHNRSVSQNDQQFSPPHNFPPPPAAAEESRFTKNSGNMAGGRFVKKSAAALIAKKQGQQIEDPNSATEIIDPRIAEEIKNLRDREEELKRSRSELALVTSPPPSSYQMSPTKKSPNQSMMRNAQSFDHLDNPMGIRSPIERSHSSHNVYHLKSAMSGGGGGQDSPYHLGSGYEIGRATANYGSMPRPQHRKEGSYHPQMREHRGAPPQHDNCRQSRNGDFFRQAPTASEATNAGWQKSIPSFETKPSPASSTLHPGLQLPPANISLSSYQRSGGDKYQNPRQFIGKHADRKIGL